jgi:hypothetical protein
VFKRFFPWGGAVGFWQRWGPRGRPGVFLVGPRGWWVGGGARGGFAPAGGRLVPAGVFLGAPRGCGGGGGPGGGPGAPPPHPRPGGPSFNFHLSPSIHSYMP